jgi:hypothetical protein
MEHRDYAVFIRQLLELKPESIFPGRTSLFLWQSKEHLAQWYQRKLPVAGEDVRIVTVPNEFLPQLHSPGIDYTGASVAAIATSCLPDLSDTCCLHWITVERNL